MRNQLRIHANMMQLLKEFKEQQLHFECVAFLSNTFSLLLLLSD